MSDMMAFILFVIAVVASAIAVFTLYNAEPVTVRFLAWRAEHVPLAAVVLIAVAVGVLPVSLIGFVTRLRLRHRIRQLEAQIRELERFTAGGVESPKRSG
jgi:uncharacterized integral membrane protein